MPKIVTTVEIKAPIQRVFDLSRSIDFHLYTQVDCREQAVSGLTCGLAGLGDIVTWRARHFGVFQHLTAIITVFNPPFHFRDSMVSGAFKRFDHDHLLKTRDGITLLTDIFDYQAPLGWLGRVADILFLKRYMTRFFEKRNRMIKKAAEGNLWKQYVT